MRRRRTILARKLSVIAFCLARISCAAIAVTTAKAATAASSSGHDARLTVDRELQRSVFARIKTKRNISEFVFGIALIAVAIACV